MNVVREIFPGRLQGRMEKALQIIEDAQEIRVRVYAPLMIRSKGKEYFVTESGQVTNRRNPVDNMQPGDLEDIIFFTSQRPIPDFIFLLDTPLINISFKSICML